MGDEQVRGFQIVHLERICELPELTKRFHFFWVRVRGSGSWVQLSLPPKCSGPCFSSFPYGYIDSIIMRLIYCAYFDPISFRAIKINYHSSSLNKAVNSLFMLSFLEGSPTNASNNSCCNYFVFTRSCLILSRRLSYSFEFMLTVFVSRALLVLQVWPIIALEDIGFVNLVVFARGLLC